LTSGCHGEQARSARQRILEQVAPRGRRARLLRWPPMPAGPERSPTPFGGLCDGGSGKIQTLPSRDPRSCNAIVLMVTGVRSGQRARGCTAPGRRRPVNSEKLLVEWRLESVLPVADRRGSFQSGYGCSPATGGPAQQPLPCNTERRSSCSAPPGSVSIHPTAES